jgi:mono/diheme cytochrome c family protein
MNSGKNLTKALALLLALIPLSSLLAIAALSDGATVYDTNCARCHRLGTYDTSGSAPDLLGKSATVASYYTAGVSGHKGITLSGTQLTDLKTFVDNPTTAPPSTALDITTSILPNGTAGTAYSQTLSASGGVPPYTWSYSGTLPQGLGVTSAGSVTGTPTAAGDFSFTVRVADSKSSAVTKTISLTISAPPSTPMSASDKNLFLANCVNCHTPSGLEYRSASQIQAAISGNVGGMGTSQLKALSAGSLDGIARTLVPSTPESISCSTCHSSLGSGTTTSAGQTIYDGNCAGCHKLSTYDTAGSAPDLYQSARVDSYYTAGASGHKGITLTATDITNLKAFLNNPTSSPAPAPTPTPTPTPTPAPTPTPTTGQSVYDSSCAGCHRMNTYDTSGSAPDLYQTTRIDSYYTAGVSGHKGITLSATDIDNLKTFVGTTMSTPSPTPTPTPTPATGQAVYDSDCAGCHRLGSYDKTGSAPDLSGDGNKVGTKYSADKKGHKGITLTATEISNLSTFLNAGVGGDD